MKKKKSIFGLIVALATAAYAGYYYYQMNWGFKNSFGFSGYGQLEYAFGKWLVDSVLKDFVTFAIVAAAIALLSYFASFRWGYLLAASSLVIAYFQLPSMASPTSELVIELWVLCILLVVAFFIDNSLRHDSGGGVNQDNSSLPASPAVSTEPVQSGTDNEGNDSDP